MLASYPRSPSAMVAKARPPLDLSTSSTRLGDDMASLGVAELKAMLAEKRRRNLEEMARSMSLDRSVDSISVERE